MSRIAVIGAGISGMSAAYLLSRKHEVWLLEREQRLGGHTHTHAIQTSRGTIAVDSGFIVHNDRTYPNLTRLFRELGVERRKSDMSFSCSSRLEGMEYSSRGLRGFFATRRNLFRPSHYRLFAEIVRFNRRSAEFLQRPHLEEITLEEYLRDSCFSADFARLYLYPMAAAVWSTSPEEIGGFPAVTLLRFFSHHGFLTINNHPQWYVVKGGSSQYIAPLTAPYRDRILTGACIQSIAGRRGGIAVHLEDGSALEFDEVVFACHAPQALQLLADASALEKSVLGSFRTNANEVVLHKDSRFLPDRPAARASWNYHLQPQASAATLTYHMNRLQGIQTPEDYCVTLNDPGSIDPGKTLQRMTYAHPLYTLAAIRAQARWREISGARRMHFCGAYWFYGFHEDGLNSAIRVARALGVEWQPND
ncbi:MAG TPA: FAD-dependent oxidoreductase [Acidobacteriaceae bacterium]|nr:FAD-dependent oxidoreductase [Acidobacteriaceae bacterium]